MPIVTDVEIPQNLTSTAADVMPNLVKYLPVADLQPDTNYSRKKNSSIDKDLHDSILSKGIIYPIIVREDGGKFIIIDGVRRFNQALELELKTMRCFVVISASRLQALILQLIVNLQQPSLSPIEASEQLRSLLEEFEQNGDKPNLSDIGKLLGKSIKWVSETIALMNLPNEVRLLLDKKLVTNTQVLIQMGELHKEKPKVAAALIEEIETGKSVSISTVNKLRGKGRKKRECKPQVELSELPDEILKEFVGAPWASTTEKMHEIPPTEDKPFQQAIKRSSKVTSVLIKFKLDPQDEAEKLLEDLCNKLSSNI